DLLDGKVEFTHRKERLDRTIAVLSAMVNFLQPKPEATKDEEEVRVERAARFYDICAQIVKSKAMDVLIVPLNQMLNENRLGTTVLKDKKSASTVLQTLKPVLTRVHG